MSEYSIKEMKEAKECLKNSISDLVSKFNSDFDCSTSVRVDTEFSAVYYGANEPLGVSSVVKCDIEVTY